MVIVYQNQIEISFLDSAGRMDMVFLSIVRNR
jgi:hypothetical protein